MFLVLWRGVRGAFKKRNQVEGLRLEPRELFSAKHSLGTRSIGTALEFVEMQNFRPHQRVQRIEICILTGSLYGSSAVKA